MKHARAAFAASVPEPPAMVPALAALIAEARCVAVYHPIRGEPPPTAIELAARAANCAIALPFLGAPDAAMTFREYALQATLHKSAFGTWQPASDAPLWTPDLVILPLVAFDRGGNRLGQGAGHYDRALAASCAKRIGLAWSMQEVAALPRDPWDVPLDAILTEQEWIVP